MANLTITVEEDTLKRAQVRAETQGTSLHKLLHTYLEKYASTREGHSDTIRTLLARSRRSKSSSHGKRTAREELHQRQG